jgi:hypothetical protein
MFPPTLASHRRLDIKRATELRSVDTSFMQTMEVGSTCKRLAEFITHDLDIGPRHHNRKLELVELLLANLITAAKKSRAVAISRNTSEPGAGLRNKVLDAMVQHRYLICRKGSEISGKQTRYDFTEQAWRWLQKFDLSAPQVAPYLIRRPTDIPPSQLALQFAPVVLRNPRKEAMEFNAPPEIEELEDRILSINDFLCQFSYSFQREFRPGRFMTEQPIVGVRSIFNNDFEHGGRLYSGTLAGYQAMTKEERSTLRINGESCIEYDFSGFHPRLLYHKLGIAISGDVYKPKKVFPEFVVRNHFLKRKAVPNILRTAVKTTTNICLNAKSRGQANSAAAKYYRDNYATGGLLMSKSIRPAELVGRILKAHKPLKEFFFSQIGSRLNASDDLPLMLDMLEAFKKLGRPALGLHDAIICQNSMRQQSLEIMQSCYANHYGFEPVIKRSF